MAHSYTPGLRVAAHARLTRERRLPLPGEVLVQAGDQVEGDTVVARTELPGAVTTLHVANLLGIDAADVPEAMQLPEGSAVNRDQVIARGGGFLGMFRREVRTPIQGSIESVSKITGQVLLRGVPQPIAVDAFVRGVVGRVLPREGVAVHAEAAFIQGIFGIGGERRGRLRMLVRDPAEPLAPGRLQDEHRGAVVVGGSFASLQAIRRAIEVKAQALVVGGVGYQDLTELLGHPIGVAVTGSETIGITLVATEGFGTIPMAARTYALLGQAEGREASVNGATQIRAGVIRPEVLVPLEGVGSGAAEPEPKGVEAGSPVRVIREPYFGLLGEVVGLPPELRELPTETLVRVAEIRLADGRTVTVPRSNLERIEG